MTRLCIFGAGAIGGEIAARLARSGDCAVSVVARGAHLEAIRTRGLRLIDGDDEFTVAVAASDDPARLGPQDYVIVATKAHDMAALVEPMQPLLKDDTALVFAQNGIPWWYFHGHGGALENRRLESVDPGGVLWERLGPERALGAVVWFAAVLVAPGVIRHAYGERLPVAEPRGEKTERVQRLSHLLSSAGFKSPVKSDLRPEIWLKLWGNLSFNPVSVLTQGTLEQLAADPHARAVIAAMMAEAQTVAEALGIRFPVSIAERIAMAARVGAHRTSMLEDVLAGRPTELEALLGAVIELGKVTEHATPALKLVYDLARFRSRMAAGQTA